MGLKEDLRWAEGKIREIEEGKRSPKGPPSLEYLQELKANIEEELKARAEAKTSRSPAYRTFRPWQKRRPKGQGGARFWRGRP